MAWLSPSSTPQLLLTPISSQQPSALEVLSEWEFIIAPIIFTALAFFTRFYKIGLSPIVTWDEAQLVGPQPSARCAPDANHPLCNSFGKFGSHYLKREFYFDVRPPCALPSLPRETHANLHG